MLNLQASSVKTTHRYVTDDGVVYPSVSAIKACIASPALVGWRVKQSCLRAISALESGELTERLAVEGKERTRKWLARAADDATASSMLRGSFLHELADRASRGQPLPERMTEESRARLQGFLQYLEEQRPVYVASEISLVNVEHRYCGTADAIIKSGDEYMILDYKTSKGVYADYALQLTAYAHATHYVREDEEGTQELIPLEQLAVPSRQRGLVVRLKTDGYELHQARLDAQLEDGQSLWQIFLAARALYSYVQAAQEFGAPAFFTDAREIRKQDLEAQLHDEFAEHLRSAPSHDALEAVYRMARGAGVWDEALLQIARQRRAELGPRAS